MHVFLLLLSSRLRFFFSFFFFQAEDGIRDLTVTGVQTCALPIYAAHAAVPHAAAQPAHHLEDHVGHGPLVRHSALDPLGDELGGRDLALLEVAVRRAFFHGAETAHAPDHLEAAALEQERLARALFGAAEERAHHHAGGAGGEGLHHVARVLDAAVGDDGDLARGRDGLEDRRDLRHPDARDDARCADRAGADADLDRKSVV